VATLLHFSVSKRKPLQVLIADDNQSVRTALKSALADVPEIEVCAVAADGLETVKMALDYKPDLLIVDVVMPGMNGLEAISVLRQRLPSAKFIVFTMYAEQFGRTLTKSAGVDVVVAKSEGLAGLKKKIASILAEND
jgi:DNA-binding NarL/FixJ family response regulator